MGKRKGTLMIATVGDDIDAVLVGIRDHPVQKLILMHTSTFTAQAQEVQAKVGAIFVATELRLIDDGQVLMDTLRQVADIHAQESLHFDDIVVNVSSGDKMQTCSALSAAFVHGVPAIGVMDDAPFALPVLKFSYAELISDAKYRILESLQRIGGHADSLNDLSKQSGVEKSLLSYHLRTTREGKGLEDMGLVDIERGTFGRLGITLTEMGNLILMGRPSLAPPQ
ncbi:MAG: DUF6293 family protein [Thermoplasmatota archaeon]